MMNSPASDPANRRPVAWGRLARENAPSPKGRRLHNRVLVRPSLPGGSCVEQTFGSSVCSLYVATGSHTRSSHPGVVGASGSDRSCQLAGACSGDRTTAKPSRPQQSRDGGTGSGRPSRGRGLPVCSIAATSGSSSARVPTCPDRGVNPECHDRDLHVGRTSG
jgi:hypothetical protein